MFVHVPSVLINWEEVIVRCLASPSLSLVNCRKIDLNRNVRNKNKIGNVWAVAICHCYSKSFNRIATILPPKFEKISIQCEASIEWFTTNNNMPYLRVKWKAKMNKYASSANKWIGSESESRKKTGTMQERKKAQRKTRAPNNLTRKNFAHNLCILFAAFYSFDYCWSHRGSSVFFYRLHCKVTLFLFCSQLLISSRNGLMHAFRVNTHTYKFML